MKNNILHKLPLILLLLWEHILPAQVMVYDSVPPWGSIIRAIDARQNILYFEAASGQGGFLLHSPTTCASIDLPSGMSVTDFEVDASGNAWFCGDMRGTPAVGTFDIGATFAGSAPIHYALCTSTDWHPMGPHTLSRMDIKSIGTVTVIAAVGEFSPDLDGTPVYTTGMVLSAYPIWGAMDPWQIHVSYDKEASVYYTDIVALFDLFVAVGTRRSGADCIVKTYKKFPNFPCQPFLYNTISTLQTTSPCIDKVLATGIHGKFASLVQCEKRRLALFNHVLSFDASGGIASAQTTAHENPSPAPSGYSPAGMRLQEVRYSALLGNTLALHRGYLSTDPLVSSPFAVESWLVPFPWDSASPNLAWRLPLGYEHSLDTVTGGTPIASGNDYSFNYLNTYNRIQLFSPGCARPIMAKPPEQTNSTGMITSAERSYTHTARDFTFYPTVTPVNTIPECDE